jgi:hypothetical protein
VYLPWSWNCLGPSRRRRKDDGSGRATVQRRQGEGGARGPALLPVRGVHGRGHLPAMVAAGDSHLRPTCSYMQTSDSPIRSAAFGGVRLGAARKQVGLLGFGWRASHGVERERLPCRST